MGQKKVLIVDDEADILEAIRFKLEAEGFQCIAASDGEEGLSKAKTEKPDLVLLDVGLPKINGYKVCRLLKFDESFRKIPIIMLTARTQEKDVQIGQETGADEYVKKPFDLELLASLVKRYLSEK